MKTHTSSFKEQIKLIGKEIDSRITFGSTVLGKNDLNAVTPSYQGAILKSVMKQLDIDSNVAIPIGTILKYEFGLKVNGEYEYINYGNYVVYNIEKQEDTNSYKIVCYDKLLYSMLDYVKLPITYPISIRDYINAISTALGLKFANKSGTFANYNKQIQADLYDGLGYTFRDVLDELAQVTASTICLNNNDELEIRYITETGDTIDEEYLKDVNVNFGEKFGAVNTIVLSRSGDSDSVYYPEVLPANPYEIKISDNQIMNGNDRADFLPDIYNKLNGLEFYTNDFVSTGIVYYDLCDRYSVKVGDNIYSCVMFNDEVLVTQGLEENIYTELPEQTKTDYKHASKDDRMINQVYLIVKKNEAEILAVINTTQQLQKEINPTKDESGSEIIIENASNNPLTYLEIEGKSTQKSTDGKNLLPKDNISNKYVSVNENGTYNIITGTPTSTIYATGKGFSLPAGTYTFSSTELMQDSVQIYLWNETDNNYDIQLNYYTDKLTFTLTDTKTMHIMFLLLPDRTVVNQTFGLQVEKGSNKTNWEEFGKMPSPQTPSEIESVGYENLLDLENIEISWATINDNLLKILNSLDVGTYTIILNFVVDSIITETTENIFGFIFIHNSGNLNHRQTFNNNLTIGEIYTIKSEIIITSEIKGKFSVAYLYGSGNDAIGPTATSKTQNCILTKGTQEHSYIPYGKYGIEVETVGKNLLPIDSILSPYVSVNSNGTYNIISGTITSGLYPTGKEVVLPAGTYTISSTELMQQGVQIYLWNATDNNYDIMLNNYLDKKTFTLTDTKIMRVMFYLMPDTTLVSKTFGLQVEKGSVASKWEQYHESNISVIPLNEPLRSLSNGVKDIAYIRNNKLYVKRKIGSLVLDGVNYYFTNKDGTTYNNMFITNSLPNIKQVVNNNTLGNISSTYFKNEVTDILFMNDVIGIGSRADYHLSVGFGLSSKINSAELANQWLKENNTQVDYELATPVTEELGEIEMLKTLKGYNNISTTDKLLPIINLTYVRDTIIANYVENHVTELKLTEKEIKASVESVSSSVDGLNTTINRVEEITTDNSQVINVISTNIDKSTGEVREVTTTTGFTFNADGMTIDDGSGFKAEHTANGTYYKDGNSIVGQYTKDGSKQKDLELFGIYSYGKESIDDTPMFIGQLYRDENGEECFGHFVNI